MQSDATTILKVLDERLQLLVQSVERTEVYQTLVNPNTEGQLIVKIMRNIMFETYSYGRFLTEATATAIGRLGDDRHRYIPGLMKHLLSEVGHPEMALTAYVELGGDELTARYARPSPASFALGAVSRQLAQVENPFSYLGYMYLLEGSTAIIAPRFRDVLASVGRPVPFITLHAEEDVEHTKFLAEEISNISQIEREAGDAILIGFDYFAAVYPNPIWAWALEKSRDKPS